MSHVLRVGQPDQIAYFRAYNTDGSANTSLTASTTGLTVSVFRVGASSVSIASLSNKAADNTAHADGAIRNVGGNLYTIDIPDAAVATQIPSICVRGSYTGGVIEGLEHPIVAYDPSVVAVGANTTTPPTATQNAAATLGALLVDYTSTGTVGYVLNAFFAMIEYVTGWRFKSKALEQAPTGATVSVTPVVSQTPVRVIGSNIETFIGDLSDIRVGVFSGTDPVDLSTMGDLEVCVQLKSGVDLDVVSMADITIDGDDNNYFSWTPNGESVDAVRAGKWSLRKASNKQVIAYGAWIVADAALSDAS